MVRMNTTPDTALLVVTLGTPESPTAPAVRRYLAEFLSDRRVVAIPPLFWKPLLYGVILPIRGPKSAEKYAKVWLPEGSPLAVYTRRLADGLQAVMPDWHVEWAMRYGEPALRKTLDGLRARGIRRIVVLPMYPQYSTTTTASIQDVVEAWRTSAPEIAVEVIQDYCEDAGWVAAIAESIRAHWQVHGRSDKLMFSFHGLPQRVANAGDPYPQQCERSAQAIAAALGLGADEWQMGYQSRFGAERWLQPYAEPTLWALAEGGMRSFDLVCPGFATDCLETLEEVALGFAETLAERGATLSYIPCLNASDAHAHALAAVARRA
ncbi:ferrochelatase [Xanthomonas perforans]